MTRHIPAAARTVIATAIDDARRSRLTDPTVTALLVAEALTQAGWTITPTTTGPQTAE